MDRYGSQTTLDAFLNPSPSSPPPEPQGSKSPEPQESKAELAEARPEIWRCEVCGEPSGPFAFKRLRLHPGALKLYCDNYLRWSARADMDVYNRCRKGLIENLRFLKMFYEEMLYYRGKPKAGEFTVVGVGKAYDDSLYIYGIGRFPQEYEGFRVNYVEAEDVEALERFHSHLQSVPEDIIDEALGEPEEKILPYQQSSLSEFVEAE
jgi:hypothetical protein